MTLVQNKYFLVSKNFIKSSRYQQAFTRFNDINVLFIKKKLFCLMLKLNKMFQII